MLFFRPTSEALSGSRTFQALPCVAAILLDSCPVYNNIKTDGTVNSESVVGLSTEWLESCKLSENCKRLRYRCASVIFKQFRHWKIRNFKEDTSKIDRYINDNPLMFSDPCILRYSVANASPVFIQQLISYLNKGKTGEAGPRVKQCLLRDFLSRWTKGLKAESSCSKFPTAIKCVDSDFQLKNLNITASSSSSSCASLYSTALKTVLDCFTPELHAFSDDAENTPFHYCFQNDQCNSILYDALKEFLCFAVEERPNIYGFSARLLRESPSSSPLERLVRRHGPRLEQTVRHIGVLGCFKKGQTKERKTVDKGAFANLVPEIQNEILQKIEIYPGSALELCGSSDSGRTIPVASKVHCVIILEQMPLQQRVTDKNLTTSETCFINSIVQANVRVPNSSVSSKLPLSPVSMDLYEAAGKGKLGRHYFLNIGRSYQQPIAQRPAATVTLGYGLNCLAVHFPNTLDGHGEDEAFTESFERSVHQCLEAAHSAQCESVVFPCLLRPGVAESGTDSSDHMTMRAALDWLSTKYPDTTIRRIIFASA